MTAIGVIPARYGSTRLPGKPLKDIAGKPMIQHVYEMAIQAEELSSVIVATDDRRIMEAVSLFGGQAVMTASGHPNGTSRVAEAVRRERCDIVVNIQGDEPFLSHEMVDQLVRLLAEDDGAPSATLCRRITPERFGDASVVKTVFDRDGNALYFSRSLIPYPRCHQHHLVFEHIGIYAYRSEFLQILAELPLTPLAETESLEQLKVLEHGYKMKVAEGMVPYFGLSIDTEEDLNQARQLMKGSSNA